MGRARWSGGLVAKRWIDWSSFANTYCRCPTPVQLAARSLLERAPRCGTRFSSACASMTRRSARLVTGADGATVLPADGGWSAVVRVCQRRARKSHSWPSFWNATASPSSWILFDFPQKRFWWSVCCRPGVFARGVQLVQNFIQPRDFFQRPPPGLLVPLFSLPSRESCWASAKSATCRASARGWATRLLVRAAAAHQRDGGTARTPPTRR